MFFKIGHWFDRLRIKLGFIGVNARPGLHREVGFLFPAHSRIDATGRAPRPVP